LKRLNIPQLLVLNAYWVGLSFMWNALHPILLPAVLLNYVPDAKKNTYLGLLTFVGLIIAMIVQPISGSLSDRWKSRFGRRRPLAVLGTAFDFPLSFHPGLGRRFDLAVHRLCRPAVQLQHRARTDAGAAA
jgi:MFS family permease